MGRVYFIGAASGPIKVGWTGQKLGKRLAELQCGNPATLKVLGAIEGCRGMEATCHRVLDEFGIRGEWFERAPSLDLLIDLGLGGPFEADEDLRLFLAARAAAPETTRERAVLKRLGEAL